MVRHYALMRLRDYFGGVKISLHSPLRPQEVSNRVNCDARSPFWPFSIGTVGGVFMGRLRLWERSSAFFDYNAKPLLAARLVERTDGTTIEATYRAPVVAYVFFPVWYGFLAADVGSFRFVDISEVLTVVPLLIFGALPVALHYMCTRDADSDLHLILRFLEDAVEALPIEQKA